MIQAITHDQNILKQPARPATAADQSVAKDLADTLLAYRQNCLGMAANMIGQPVAIIAVLIGQLLVIMINPRLKAKSGPYQTEEGCLSLTGQRPCQRYQQITVSFTNMAGRHQEVTLSGLAAETVQHELDHLAGTII